MHSPQIVDTHCQKFTILDGLNSELPCQVIVININLVKNVFNLDIIFFRRDHKVNLAKIVAFSNCDINNILGEWKHESRHAFLDKVDLNNMISLVIQVLIYWNVYLLHEGANPCKEVFRLVP